MGQYSNLFANCKDIHDVMLKLCQLEKRAEVFTIQVLENNDASVSQDVLEKLCSELKINRDEIANYIYDIGRNHLTGCGPSKRLPDILAHAEELSRPLIQWSRFLEKNLKGGCFDHTES